MKMSKEQLDNSRLQTEASPDEAVRLLMKAELTEHQQLHDEGKVTLATLMRVRQMIISEQQTA